MWYIIDLWKRLGVLALPGVKASELLRDCWWSGKPVAQQAAVVSVTSVLRLIRSTGGVLDVEVGG